MQYLNVNRGWWPFIFCINFLFYDNNASFKKRNCVFQQRYQLTAKAKNIIFSTIYMSTRNNNNYHSPFHQNDWRPYYCKSHLQILHD